jgi:hypothetical protein
MRKLTALLMVLLFVTGAAFAQVPDGFSIGGWGRADFVPVQGVFEDDQDPVFLSGIGSGWGPAYTGLNFRFKAADGRVGGGADISRNVANGPSNGDNINIWAKPFGSDILEINIGQFRDGRFRGPGTDGNFQGFVGGPGKNGDLVFHRFDPNAGALFISKPVTGLSIYAQVKTDAISLTGISPEISPAEEAKDVYKKIQAGLAYDIAGIGLARAQWVGNTMDNIATTADATTGVTTWSASNARIEAAFKLTAVDGLNLDVGVKLPIPVKEEWNGIDTIYQGNFQVSVAGDFKAGDFGITYGVYGAFGGSVALDNEDNRDKLSPTFDVILVPSFYIAGLNATVGADVGFRLKGESSYLDAKQNNEETIFGLGGWISRDLGKGSIKTGIAYQLPKYAANGIDGQSAYLTWPIILEVSF